MKTGRHRRLLAGYSGQVQSNNRNFTFHFAENAMQSKVTLQLNCGKEKKRKEKKLNLTINAVCEPWREKQTEN